METWCLSNDYQKEHQRMITDDTAESIRSSYSGGDRLSVTAMRVFLTGVSCVGKTTVGKELAELLGANFFDLDDEIEMFFGTGVCFPYGNG